MSRYKILIVIALVLFMTVPSGLARAQGVPTLISAGVSGSGTVVIVDGLAPSDTVIFSMTGVTFPADNTVYEGWLISDDGNTKLSTGTLTVTADGSLSHTFISPTGENFIAKYDKVVITVEPVPDSDPGPSDDVAFSHQVTPSGMAHIRHLLTEWPEGADAGILTNLREQLRVAIGHASDAKKSTTVAAVKDNIQKAIDAIEGDGGVLAHAQDRKHAAFASNAAPGDAVIAEHSKLVETNGENAENWSILARDQALSILDLDSLVGAQTLAGAVGAILQDALDGIDATGQGGADQAYVEAQLMATYTLPSPAVAPAGPALPIVGDSAVPVLAQITLAVALMLLFAGGFLLVRSRRSRSMA
jgi:hypothetical protein